MLAITAFLVNPRPEHRVWVTTTLAATLAALIHFRPNALFAFSALLAVMMFGVNMSRSNDSRRQIAWAVAAYMIVAPLSLIHNLYFGESFTLFTNNISINSEFDWREIITETRGTEAVTVIWEQFANLLYWKSYQDIPFDINFMIVFWGSQLILLVALSVRIRNRLLGKPHSLIMLLPLTYIIPMLQFSLFGYYPRHLVAASLLCLCAALIVWPRKQHGSALTS
jgi:hypothetical protein